MTENELYLRIVLLFVGLMGAYFAYRYRQFRLALKDIVTAMEVTRAGRLMLKEKFFVVVAWDEPYFIETLMKIREVEMGKSTWSATDENVYTYWMNRLLPQG